MSAAIKKRPKSSKKEAPPAPPPVEVEQEEAVDEEKLRAMYRLSSRPGFKLIVPSLPQTRTVKGRVVEMVSKDLNVSDKEFSLVRKLFDTDHPEVRKVTRARTKFFNDMDWLGYKCSFEPGGRFLCTKSIETCYRRLPEFFEVPRRIVDSLDAIVANPEMDLAADRTKELYEFVNTLQTNHPEFKHWAEVISKLVKNSQLTDEDCVLFLTDEYERVNAEFQRVVRYFNENHYRAVVEERRAKLAELFTDNDYPSQIVFEPSFRLVQLTIRDKFTDPRLQRAVTKQFVSDYTQALDSITGRILLELDKAMAELETNLRKKSESGLPHQFNRGTFSKVSNQFQEAIRQLGMELGFSDQRLEDMLNAVSRKIGAVNVEGINVYKAQEASYRAGTPLQVGIDSKRDQIATTIGSLREQLATAIQVVSPRRVIRD